MRTHLPFRGYCRSLLGGGLSHKALRKQIPAGHRDSFQIVEQRTPGHARRTEHLVGRLLGCDPDLLADDRLPLFYLGVSLRVVRPLNGLPVLPRLPVLQALANTNLLPDLSRRC